MELTGEGFELLEHTADIGIRAWGASLAEAFEQAAQGLVEILGAGVGPGASAPDGSDADGVPGARGWRVFRVIGDDAGALLVDLLNEILFLVESEGVSVESVSVQGPSRGGVEARLAVRPADRELQGVGVKAATYHQLRVDRRPGGGVVAQVYLDV